MTSIRSTTSGLARTIGVVAALATLTAGAVAASESAASAAGSTTSQRSHGDDDRVIRTGSCGGSVDWKVKVKTDDGRLEVEGEIDSNVSGQVWRWTLRHNGSVSDRGTGTTTGRSGSFEVERTIVDLAGTDTVVFRAVRNGQVCRGVVNY